MGKMVQTKTKIATISSGEVFGESSLFRGSEDLDFNGLSEFSVEAESLSVRIFYC
jgi:hypothetical protein